MLEKIYGLRNSRPLMCSTRISGGSTFLFESLGQHYIYDEPNHMVLHITEPSTVGDIVDIIRDHGLRGLSTQIIESTRNRDRGGLNNEMMVSY